MRYLPLDEEMDKILTTVCDIALKSGGWQVHLMTVKIEQSIRAMPEAPNPQGE